MQSISLAVDTPKKVEDSLEWMVESCFKALSSRNARLAVILLKELDRALSTHSKPLSEYLMSRVVQAHECLWHLKRKDGSGIAGS